VGAFQDFPEEGEVFLVDIIGAEVYFREDYEEGDV